MTGRLDFNYEEAIHGVLETRTALDRARTCVDRLEQLLSERPRSFPPVAEAALRLRDRLVEDLGTLEAALARADSGESRSGAEGSPERDPDVPLADKVALGGQ